MTLLDAADVLNDLANGRQPERSKLIAGALALDTLVLSGTNDRDLLDAAAGLQTLATGGTLDLDDAGRERSAHLERVVRLAEIRSIRGSLDG